MANAADLRIGRYQVTGELGRGAMGVVYRATDPQLGRDVAIKTIDLNLDADEREGYEARFYQEARAAGGLSHPNIVTIHDLGQDGDRVYMAMEFLDGRELRHLLASARPPGLAHSVGIARQVALGLAYAHKRGIVHRDIKPANIMVLDDGTAKITDFGIARMRASSVRTQTGMRLGSPRYMSPEQVLGQRLDHRSDVFSLGVVFYETLVRQPPFAGDSVEALMYQTINCQPTPPSQLRPDVPPMLDLIVARMLAKSPDDRYASCDDIAADLDACARRHDLVAIDAEATADVIAPPQLQLTNTGPLFARTVEQTRREERAIDSELAATGMRISPQFDSLAATQRLAGVPPGADERSATNAPPAPLGTPLHLGRAWTKWLPTRSEWLFMSVVLSAAGVVGYLSAIW